MDEGMSIVNQTNMGEASILILCSVFFFIVADYGVDMHKVYPIWVINSFREPWVRFCSYIAVYILACVNIYLALLLALAVVFLHIDYLNLVEKKPIPYTQ